MGVCSSCLGRERDHDLSDEDEQSRLLFADPHANHYGGFGDNHAGAIPADPQEVQREFEALQKIVTSTSTHLVDIFAMAPQNALPLAALPTTATSTLFPAHEARLVRYQDILAKISASDPTSKANQYPMEHTLVASDGWISDDQDVAEMTGHTPVKSEGIGALLGGFADADSVMK